MLVVSSCGSTTEASDPVTPDATGTTAETAPAPVGDERGALVEDEVLGQVDQSVSALGAVAHRVVYRSTSGVDGSGVEVSGTVFVPSGPVPAGGRPVVTIGHGTTGVTDECAPSLYPNLLGSITSVTPFLELGAVVAVTDFQGLGTDGPHPYLNASAAGYDLIDAVRAARAIAPDAGTRWAALGTSQGGQAVWAAAEMADDYGDGLEFVGSAALSPAADLTPLAPEGGELSLTVPQRLLMPLIVEGFRTSYPQFEDADFLSGGLLEFRDVLLACTGPLATQKLQAAGAIGPDDIAPRSQEAYDSIRAWLEDNALPREQPAGPMMVLVGSQDTLTPAVDTEAATRRACELGAVIDFRVRPDQGHADAAAVDEGVEWVVDRFLGTPPVDSCATA